MITRITIVGAGYVGMSLSVLLAKYNEVLVHDIHEGRVALINDRKSTIKNNLIDKFLDERPLNLRATSSPKEAYRDADLIIVATPTDYNDRFGEFDTSSVRAVIREALHYNPSAFIVIKSTVPIGFTDQMNLDHQTSNILFSPEFLRENRALEDNLRPSRIVVGCGSDSKHLAKRFANLLRASTEWPIGKAQILITEPREAESIKLFSNAYLAMRVSFFNELDSYCETAGLSTHQVIKGVGLDPRIGEHYNNPSFGYSGYCLPKDTKQLLSNYDSGRVESTLIKAIVDSNSTRETFIVNQILKRTPQGGVIGIYRLGSSDSSMQRIMRRLSAEGGYVVVYEPELSAGSDIIVGSLSDFKEICDIVVANRLDDEIRDIDHKVYTRDISV
jgi:UDPglucose 6-dehydrogenase